MMTISSSFESPMPYLFTSILKKKWRFEIFHQAEVSTFTMSTNKCVGLLNGEHFVDVVTVNYRHEMRYAFKKVLLTYKYTFYSDLVRSLN